jgi:cyclic lactone autoinducer peptide
MLSKVKAITCSLLITILTFVAVGSALGCPIFNYQPEPPKKRD